MSEKEKMEQLKRDLIWKLCSRKFWVALTDFVGMLLVALKVSQDTVTTVVALIMSGAGLVAYLIAEGWADGQGAAAPKQTVVQQIVDDDAHPPEMGGE